MHLSRRHRIPVVAFTAIGLVAAAGATTMAIGNPGSSSKPSAAQQPAALGAGPQESVIVMLKDQHANLPVKTAKAQRKQATDTDQAPLVGHAKATGAKDVKTYSVINGFSAKVTPAEAAHLAADPAVASVVLDTTRVIKPVTPQDKAAMKAAVGTNAPQATNPQIANTCPKDPSKPLLEPEALQTTHTAFTDPTLPQAQNIVDGKGVKVGWIADGLDPKIPDFQRADGTPVFADYQDFSGTDPAGPQLGGEAFGDASSIAAQGRTVYDLSQHVDAANPLPAGCNVTVRGVAPGVSLYGINVFGSAASVFNSTIIQAIDYLVNVDNVDVINESFGGNSTPTDGVDPTALADDAAVAAGVTVVASTGDAGPTGTVGSPAVDPSVISAGAITNGRVQAQSGYSGARKFATSWANDNNSSLSSGGVTDRGRVLDLVATGQDGWAVCTPDPHFSECTDWNSQHSGIYAFGGTSEASPLIAGGAALVIEAYKNTHNGVRPTPALVKQLLTSTATDLGLPEYEQGAGEMNTFRAVRAAMSVKDANGSPAPQGDGLLAATSTGDTQISLIGNGGSTKTETVSVTNTSPNAQVVTAHGRTLDPKPVGETKSSITVALNDPNAPSWLDGIGSPSVPGVVRRYAETTFTVPAGAEELQGTYSYPGNAANGDSTLRLAWIGPNGEYEADSRPQGGGAHFGQIDVRHPAAGTWTAVFFASASSSGYHGPVAYDFVSSKYTDFGTVTPSHVTIAPGATQKFTVKATLPSDAGDLSAAVEFDTALRGQSDMPLTLRTLLSTSNDGGAFSGALTGGNARNASPAGMRSFYFDVPAGKKNLSVDLTLAGATPGHNLNAVLSSPDGNVVSAFTNEVVDGSGNASLISSAQGYVDNPAKGRWLLYIHDNNSVVGDALSQTFTGHLKYNAVDAKAAGLPSGKVAAGKAVTATITVKNNGPAPEAFFADPRLTSTTSYPLVVQAPSVATIGLPFPVTATSPLFEVPSHTTKLDLTESSTIPSDFDAEAGIINNVGLGGGEPEVYGQSHGLTASASLSSPWVSQGTWVSNPTVIGPTNAAVTGTATMAAAATTQTFDGAAVASTGDWWQSAATSGTPSVAPVVVQPGQTGTITVVITPSAKSGTTVHGVVYVDDFSAVLGSGDELTGFPYSYTVK